MAARRPAGTLGSMSDVTRLLDAAAGGDRQAAADLLPLVYDELRKLAAARMAGEAAGQTLQPTALVHEAYLRLVGPAERPAGTAAATSSPPPPRPCAASWSTPPAAKRARSTAATGRGSSCPTSAAPATRTTGSSPWTRPSTRLAAEDPVAARVVELRHFAGLTIEEAAAALGISPCTADRRLGLRPGLAPGRRSPTAESGLNFFRIP